MSSGWWRGNGVEHIILAHLVPSEHGLNNTAPQSIVAEQCFQDPVEDIMKYFIPVLEYEVCLTSWLEVVF